MTQQPGQEAAVPTVETVLKEETIAQTAVEDVHARRVDPDALEEQDDRFDITTDFDLYNPEDIASEYEGDQHARKWTSYELKKATLIDEEVSVCVFVLRRCLSHLLFRIVFIPNVQLMRQGIIIVVAFAAHASFSSCRVR
jgi:hypothetical protein